jgi:alpha-tubulin suppressor-like RCC1 family protein
MTKQWLWVVAALGVGACIDPDDTLPAGDDDPGGQAGTPADNGGTRAQGGGAGQPEGGEGGAGQPEGGEGGEAGASTGGGSSGAASGGSAGSLGGSPPASGGTAGSSSVGGSGAGNAGAAGSPPDCIELGNCENSPLSPVVASGDMSCFIASDSRIRCWGSGFGFPLPEPPGGSFTQLSGGNGSYCGLGASSTIACWPAANSPSSAFVQVATWSGITLGLRADGTVQGWGDAASTGYLGWKGPIDGTARFKRVMAGWDTACGLHANGAATCWRSPHVSLGLGGNHSCRANVDGTLQCWGDDALGQASPPAAGNFIEVSAGAEHSCALQATGDVVCWGANTHGESTPMPGTYNRITSGKGFSCARDVPYDRVNCWGELPFRQSAITWQDQTYVELAAGDAHVCQASRPVTCFGDNSQGQSSPPPNTYVIAIASGSAHTCGILDGAGGGTPGRIRCWGSNSDSQSTPPNGTFIDIAAGERHTCALSPTGQIVCWGKNDRGQASAPNGQFVALGAGGTHSCGVSVTGNTVCWGDSTLGRLAAPPPPTFKELALGGPSVNAPYLSRQDAVVCGIRADDTRFCSNAKRTLATLPASDLHGFAIGDQNVDTVICALRPNKTAVCWGDITSGPASSWWTLATPPDELDFVSVGNRHACGVRPNRSVVCWGINSSGQTSVPPDLAGP